MPLDVQRIRALCFDVDGTLRDTDDQYAATFERLFRPIRFLLPGRDSRAFARRFVMAVETPVNWLYSLPDRFGIDDEIVGLGEWLHEKGLGKRDHHYLLIEGVHDMLARLAARYPLAVISARPRRGTHAFLQHFDLTRFFTCVASAQTTPRTKPWPDPVLWAARQMKVAPEECLMVGDTTVDIRAGRAAGAQTVGVLCGFGEQKELENAGADLILEQTAQLAKVLA